MLARKKQPPEIKAVVPVTRQRKTTTVFIEAWRQLQKNATVRRQWDNAIATQKSPL